MQFASFLVSLFAINTVTPTADSTATDAHVVTITITDMSVSIFTPWGRFDKTTPYSYYYNTVGSSGSTSTSTWGRFDKTTPSSTTTSSGTHQWGRFDKTTPTTTTRTLSTTTTWGRFDKTTPSVTTTSSGTHVWGRFDKTTPSTTSETTTTRTWGRFDNTPDPTTTTLYLNGGQVASAQWGLVGLVGGAALMAL
ncbi:Hypothetical protein PP7435_CHR3-0594 [Komagataella phaffii CBS 7435]|uniref:Uncharacterized protein n=1 Tax=Komagataella phaffii (strain ATCC 76273 / CBS 7435 / CECT 11047 / NRRL Y-11430 / Wegner 21-1) TaxID=981350 RepID=F2QVX4_KOMPC|nr:GQ67_03688T0 [Komagataella phaffii]AOA68825.1 GQ68_03660T0 [Komagataella phaffii GS115]CAH2449573.1 Hypothetical protein BQ9382_C3-3175 [Komagataella phaffii CBS 7435]CCA39552.1 Hypothetical protein PP7435_CHR3-0594 [Komagataella phaffii CBS 7435]